MPVRSLDSSVLKWPDHETAEAALRAWAARARATRPDIEQIGYIGSYARGDWGVGSDLDVIIVVSASDLPFAHRPRQWDLTGLPVPADVLVYTRPEWTVLMARGDRFAQTLRREAVWI